MALARRACFSFISRPLLNSKGENTCAIFGFINASVKAGKNEKGERLCSPFLDRCEKETFYRGGSLHPIYRVSTACSLHEQHLFHVDQDVPYLVVSA